MADSEAIVPFLDLSLQFQPLKAEIVMALASIFESTSFVMGPAVEEFEQAFASYCGAKHCVSLNSGTAALHLALLAMNVGPGDEVITPANSFIATAEAISFCGATPRLVDVDETATIDVSRIEAAINEKTKVILPVHLYGQPADMDGVNALAKAHGLAVLDDACQAHGAMYKGKRIGTLGNATCFSFYPGKNLGAAGDGGAVVTNDDAIAEKVRLLRNHGSVKKYHHEMIGHNFRLDSIQAAILKIKLAHLDEWNEQRRQIAARYDEHIGGLSGITGPVTAHGRQPVFHLYVIEAMQREVVEKVLREENISYGIHYPVPIHRQPAYAFLAQSVGSFPRTEMLAERIVSLPIYPGLTIEQQDRVLRALEKAASLVAAI